MGNRRVHNFQEMASQAWSEWEWRNYLVGHPMAVKGMTRCCLNNKYSVQFFLHKSEWGEIEHLIIRRHDGKPIRSWYDMQRIKDELVGSDRTAVEVYPAIQNLVDEANCYHLWVLPKGFDLPFGLHPASTSDARTVNGGEG